MRITKISVKGLFGMFDHEIPLNQESRITILHGPNGVGKSVMLHMLHGFFRNELEILRSTPFDQFRIDYQDGASVTIGKQESDATLTIQFVDGSENEIKSFEVEQPEDEEQATDTDDPAWYDYRYTSRLQTQLIDTFRLMSSRYETYRSASEISEIAYVSASIADIEEEMSSVLPNLEWLEDLFHMLETMIEGKSSFWLSAKYAPYESLREWLEIMEGRIESLREYLFSRFERDELERELSLLAVIDFYETVNARILYKEMDLIHGSIVFFSDADEDNYVPLSTLSSGEQHLLILYYRLFFETESDTLVMIDEPEISMNVVWQRNFLKDLQRIVELRQFDVLIATHSPQIIHDKWDWVVHLGAKVDD